MARVLIVDDDEMICETLSRRVSSAKHETELALTLGEGMQKVSSRPFDVVFLDVYLPDGNGIEGVAKIKATPSSPEVIIITGAADADGAELALQSGAWDYLQKPFCGEDALLQVMRALQYRAEKNRERDLTVLKKDGIIGRSSPLQACLDLVARTAQTHANVLITGETGTGKELFARAIHDNSRCSKGNFTVVDCTVLPPTLLESVLFGHEKGAYTGADRSREGLIKIANGGTLFLDEVGELSLSAQKAFLRVLQEHRFRPVGSRIEYDSHFRLISATNRNLDRMAQAGQFRSDLLFRLRSITIDLPPLRSRLGDVRDLAIHHIARICHAGQVEIKGFSPEFFEALASYDWPGNVRELVHVLEGIVATNPVDSVLFPKHLPLQIRVKLAKASICKTDQRLQDPIEKRPSPSNALPCLKDFRSSLEKQYLSRLLAASEGNFAQACRISGLGRSRLYELMKKNGLSGWEWKSS